MSSFKESANINRVSTGTRFAAMFLDHLFMSMIAMAFFIPGMISSFSGAFEITHEQESINLFGGGMIYIGLFGFALYICKDCIKGRSIAKRILKLQVLDNKTGKVASPIKCLVRNLFIVIWPIEVIVALINTRRRLGDRVAGTKLVVFDPELEQPSFNIGKLILPVAIAYGIMLLFVIPLKEIATELESQKVNYIESSFNQKSSQELEKLLSDSLGIQTTPSVKIFDKIQNEDLKYVSVILQLKENYLKDDRDFNQIDSRTKELIFSKYPKESIKAQVKYIYQTSGQMIIKISQLGKERTIKKQE